MKKLTRRQEWSIASAVLVILAASIFALHRYNERTAEQLRATPFVPRPEVVTPEIEMLREYVRIDTSNPPGREAAGARWVAAKLRDAGIEAEIIESAPGRLNVHARLRGTRPGEGLLLLHHIDVVPAQPEEWEHPPFEGRIELNLMFGRGTLDMKSIGVCHLLAFIDLARSQRKPLRDIVLLATSDEETGSEHGMIWLLRNRPDLFAGIRYTLNEGGITETLEEKISYFGIEVGAKQVVTAILEAPERETLRQARLRLEPYFSSPEPHRVTDEVRRFLRSIAPQRIENRWMAEDIDLGISRGRFWNLQQGLRELTQNVVWANGVEPAPDGGYRMETHLFSLPDEDPDARLGWLAALVEPMGVTVIPTRKDPSFRISSEFTPMFALLKREIHRQYGPVTVGPLILTNAQNDSRFLRARGITSYGIWPFPVDFHQTTGIHGANERIRIDWFRQGVELTRKVVQAYAFEEGLPE